MERPYLAPPPISRAPPGHDRLWAVFSHLSTLLGVGLLLPLVVYLVMRRESDYVAGNAREALNFHLSVFLYCLVCIPLVFVFVGILLLVAIALTSLVFAVIAAVRASDGETYRYPLTIRFVT